MYLREEICRSSKHVSSTSVTNAGTYAGGGVTALNAAKLETRSLYSVANTLVHERAHTFGLKHLEPQTPAKNGCDIAYVAGDIVQVLLLHRDTGEPAVLRNDGVSCDALRFMMIGGGHLAP